MQAAVGASSKSASMAIGKTGNNMWFVTAGFDVGDPSAGQAMTMEQAVAEATRDR